MIARIDGWFDTTLRRSLAPLIAMTESASDLFTPARVRALLSPLAARGGIADRSAVDAALAALDSDDRRILRGAGLTIGTLDIFDRRLLKPDAISLVALLAAVQTRSPCPALPPPGTTVSALAGPLPGYRAFAGKQVRVDLVERIARKMHDARKDKASFSPDAELATSFGIDPPTLAAILRACGFRVGATGLWTWRSRPRARAEPPKSKSPAFAALEGWAAGG